MDEIIVCLCTYFVLYICYYVYFAIEKSIKLKLTKAIFKRMIMFQIMGLGRLEAFYFLLCTIVNFSYPLKKKVY